jgi:arylsulfatase
MKQRPIEPNAPRFRPDGRRGLTALALTLTTLGAALGVVGAAGAADKPNILVVWGDDIGQSNISAYSRGMVGYQTPNIDRIANEGMLFTD